MTYGKISKKQSEILEYMKKEILNRGFPPSVREICQAVHLKSTSSVHAHLETLEKNGYIKRDATKPRAIEILDNNFNQVRKETINVPVIGKVAAGQPLLAVENTEGYFPVPAEFLPNQPTFMLVVQGNSMVNAGIFDGDYVMVAQQDTVENGEKVVALIEDSATVKTFYKEEEHIRLQPENDYMDPILVNPDKETFQILGKVIGVFRFINKETPAALFVLFLLVRHFHFLRHQKLSAFLGRACCFILTAFDVMYILEFFSFYFDANARKSFSKLSSICATSTKNTETLTPSPLSNKMGSVFFISSFIGYNSHTSDA